jgi:RNA polymerase sigma factor (sigma-70 family)
MNSAAKTIHADQRYIQGLMENDTATIKQIYDRFAVKVKNYIVQNNGTEDDADDIFQEALIDIYRQAHYKGLQLTCPFEAFILLVCKRKWLNELKKRPHRKVTTGPDVLSNTGEDVFALADLLQQQEDKAALFMRMYEKLGEKCREIIRWCLTGKPQEEIAAAIGVTYGYLRKKKSECMSELIHLIKSHQQNV